jgi:Nucleoside 2-deoxyribosyltransferase like
VVQTINNEKFVEQVSWESEGMGRANYILMYFDVNTKSPITLLELGLWAKNRGNVPQQITCSFVPMDFGEKEMWMLYAHRYRNQPGRVEDFRCAVVNSTPFS